MEDRQITELFFERSEQAVFELSEKYGKLCRRIALNILGDPQDAEECVNEALLAVWNNVPPERPDPLRSYVCRIVRNIALKRYKANTAAKRNSAFDLSYDELADCLPVHTIDDALDSAEMAESIDHFLGALDPVNRAVFLRRYWFCDSISDIAGDLGITEHNVSVRLSRIRSKLRKHLKTEGIWL